MRADLDDLKLDMIEELDTERGEVHFRVTFSNREQVMIRVPAHLAKLSEGEPGPSPYLLDHVRNLLERHVLENRSLQYRFLIRRGREVRAERSSQTAFAILSWCEAFLPKRIRQEDLGDAMEDLARFQREGRSGAQLIVKAITTAVVLFVNGVREVVAAFAGKKTSGS
jgi:hypothetical protein